MDMDAALRQPDRVWSYDDLASIPDDRNRYEILDGALVVSPAPRLAHQELVKRLLVLFVEQLERPGHARVFAAPTDVVLGPRRVVEPDLVVVRTERAAILEPHAIVGVPDFVVEVLSASTAQVDRGGKQRLYGEVGVLEYWLVDPDAARIDLLVPDARGVMQLHVRATREEQLVSVTFPDLVIDLAALFDGV